MAEQTKAEQDRTRLEGELRQSQRLESVGRLAGGVAHDFNNLLAAILTYGEFIAEELGPDHPLQEDVVEVRKAAQRGAALTRQLLVFSRRDLVQPHDPRRQRHHHRSAQPSAPHIGRRHRPRPDPGPRPPPRPGRSPASSSRSSSTWP